MKHKVAIVVLTDTTAADGLGRVVNALMAAKEFVEAKDDVRVIFSGAGTKWIPELEEPGHKLHAVYRATKDRVGGVCGFCAAAFGVSDAAKTSDVPILEEYGTNMSFRKLLDDGYRILTF